MTPAVDVGGSRQRWGREGREGRDMEMLRIDVHGKQTVEVYVKVSCPRRGLRGYTSPVLGAETISLKSPPMATQKIKIKIKIIKIIIKTHFQNEIINKIK